MSKQEYIFNLARKKIRRHEQIEFLQDNALFVVISCAFLLVCGAVIYLLITKI